MVWLAQAMGSKVVICDKIEALECSSSSSSDGGEGCVKCVDEGDESVGVDDEESDEDCVRRQHFQLMMRITQSREAGQPMNEIFSARRRESWTVGVGGSGLLIL